MVQFLPQAQIRGPRNIGIDQNALAQLGQAGQQLGVARQKSQEQAAEQATLQSVAEMAKQGASTEQIATTLIDSGSNRLAQLGTQTLISARNQAADRASAAAGRAQSQANFERSFGLKERIAKSEIDFKEAERRILGQGGFKDAKQKADVEAGVRKEFTGLTKDFRKVRDAFGRVQASAKDPSAAGDLALIFNYMKILDPGSVVRESEFATAQNAGGVDERTRGLFNQIRSGKRLSQSQRNDFTNRAAKLFDSQNNQFNKTTKTFRDISERIGVNPQNAVPDLSAVQPAAGRLDLSGTPQSRPNQKALQFLRQNSNDPDIVRQFDEKFGPGAAEGALGLLGG